MISIQQPTASPRPRTEAQREAARRNGSRSQGPVSRKESSRRNAVKHGLSGAGLALPDDLRAEVEAATAAFSAAWQPRDDFERALVAQAALGSARFLRLANAEVGRAQERARHAVERWDEARAAEVAELADRLATAPAASLARLRATCEGCDYLADSWHDLADALELRGGWDADEYVRARLLLGLDADPAPHRRSEVADFLRLARAVRLPEPAAEPDGPEDRAGALDELADWVQGCITELVELGDEHWEDRDRPDRDGAPCRSHFDPSPEGRLLARYMAESERMERRALAELHRYRRQGRARNEPGATEPAARPRSSGHSPARSAAASWREALPARNEPGAAGPIPGLSTRPAPVSTPPTAATPPSHPQSFS